MKCHYCGTQTDQIFCHHCGTRQHPAQEGEIPETSAAAPEEEFEWKPFENGQLVHELPIFPNYYYGEEAPDGVEEMSGSMPGQMAASAPLIQLPTGRGLWKMVLLGILTLGIYPTVIWSRMVTELNLAASRHDGKRTMPYLAMMLLVPLTLTVYMFVWFHGFCRRVGNELQRRRIDYTFGARDFWLWNILGSLILVGPFVYIHKLMKAMNLINGDFNVNG